MRQLDWSELRAELAFWMCSDAIRFAVDCSTLSTFRSRSMFAASLGWTMSGERRIEDAPENASISCSVVRFRRQCAGSDRDLPIGGEGEWSRLHAGSSPERTSGLPGRRQAYEYRSANAPAATRSAKAGPWFGWLTRPLLPLGDLLEHRIGHRADQVGGDVDAVELFEVRLHLAHREPPRVEGHHFGIKAGEPALVLGDELRLEGAGAIAGNRDRHGPALAEHGLGAVAMIAPRAATPQRGRLALVVR
jgi:hypothetical protein